MAVRALKISSSFAKELLKLVFWDGWENFGLKKDKNRSETVDCSLLRLQGMPWSFFHFIKRNFTNQRQSNSRVIHWGDKWSVQFLKIGGRLQLLLFCTERFDS